MEEIQNSVVHITKPIPQLVSFCPVSGKTDISSISRELVCSWEFEEGGASLRNFRESNAAGKGLSETMQTRITPQEMAAAARQLAKNDRGRAALARLLTLLDGEEMELDLLNQRAFLALLGGAWNGQTDVACESIRKALQETAT